MSNATARRTGRWELVPARTRAGFNVRNFCLATVRGQMPVTAAWVDVDATGRPTAVHAELDLARIDTGNPRRDSDLRKPHLLDPDHHRALTFDGVAAGTTVDGQLTGRRATRLSLDVGNMTPGDGGTVTVCATTTLDRTALGVRAPRLLIGRRIAVMIGAVFTPPSAQPPNNTMRGVQVKRRTLSVNMTAGRRASGEDDAETS